MGCGLSSQPLSLIPNQHQSRRIQRVLQSFRTAPLRKGRGFTLIELLIVIAIILILIAIALPNFLEAQNRARITKAAAHMRTIETAARTHLADYGFIYTDYNGPNQLFFETRMKRNFGICANKFGLTNPTGGGLQFAVSQADFYAQGIHCPLTTPIQYLDADEVTDPFSDGSIPMGYDSREGDWGKFKSTTAYGMYCSAGPDRVAGDWHHDPQLNGQSRAARMPYSPTNGTKSNGDMWRIVEFVPSIARNWDGYPTLQTH
ncbi:MAG: prepilin-type N-terminal cleavage/methylation domain-containing protein [Candidatus Omnitrophica bacterium]|nr:prepilin-type N-terminal cleavage/methylation domain-containing protein [Candidatus Omnitrophota bacterium]MCB9767157.1 prepilin-type N-terminal cleavage/methylation domain-containing protein [Candidatus Omnitrophota bacterium]